jgi:ABC-type transport system involved in multi-copper enzyme maturation permease subunit
VEARGLSRIVAVAANTFRETVRERVLYNLVFFAVLMTLSGLLLGQLSIRQDEKIIKDIGLAAMDLFGTAIALFIGVGLVSKEIERRSLYPLLAKPLTRDELYLGKFLGLAVTLLVNTGVMAAGLYTTLVATGRGAGTSLLAGIYPIFLSLLLVVAIAMLFSTMTSIVLAAVSTLGVVIVGRFSDVIRNMKEVAPGAPEWLVKGLYYVIPNFRAFDFKDRAAYGDPIPLAAIGEVTLYAVVYVGLLLVAGLVLFRRKDFQ